jgi:hypothetical protein
MSDQIENIFDKSKIIKWLPILKQCNFNEKDYELITNYCENHRKAEELYKKNPNDVVEVADTETTLVASLTILSKIDLNKLIFTDTDNVYHELFKIKVDYEWINVPYFIERINSCIIKQITDMINKSENKFDVGKRIISHLKLENNNNTFSPTILVFGQLYEHIKIETKITITKNGLNSTLYETL